MCFSAYQPYGVAAPSNRCFAAHLRQRDVPYCKTVSDIKIRLILRHTSVSEWKELTPRPSSLHSTAFYPDQAMRSYKRALIFQFIAKMRLSTSCGSFCPSPTPRAYPLDYLRRAIYPLGYQRGACPMQIVRARSIHGLFLTS